MISSHGGAARQPLTRRVLKWLYPGMNVKRWLLLIVLGATLVSLGVAAWLDAPGLSFGLLQIVARHAPAVADVFVEHRIVGLLLGVLGVAGILFGVNQIVRSIGAAVIPEDRELVDVIFEKRHLEHGPRVTAIGGGTGLASLLRGLKTRTGNLTAVVTVADDGGSSGRLRETGMLPPGDIRNCIAAMSTVEPLVTQLFQHRFSGRGELDGHSFGNLFIAAMEDVTGDFVTAVRETSKVLAIRGEVLPATLSQVTLGARLQDGTSVRGQVNVNKAPAPIVSAFLEPHAPPALDEAVEAILHADLVVLGPGSLYSSIVPNLLVPGIADAVRRTRAVKVYICNIMTQPNETLGYRASDHVRALTQALGGQCLDFVLLNGTPPSRPSLERYEDKGAAFVEPDVAAVEALGPRVILDDFISEQSYVRHHSPRLAERLFRLIEEGARATR